MTSASVAITAVLLLILARWAAQLWLERLNAHGNMSAKGLKQSFGIMVNYLYDLDKIETVPFDVDTKLSSADITNNDATIKNIRLEPRSYPFTHWRDFTTSRRVQMLGRIERVRAELRLSSRNAGAATSSDMAASFPRPGRRCKQIVAWNRRTARPGSKAAPPALRPAAP